MLSLLFISGGWNTFIQWGTPALMLPYVVMQLSLPIESFLA